IVRLRIAPYARAAGREPAELRRVCEERVQSRGVALVEGGDERRKQRLRRRRRARGRASRRRSSGRCAARGEGGQEQGSAADTHSRITPIGGERVPAGRSILQLDITPVLVHEALTPSAAETSSSGRRGIQTSRASSARATRSCGSRRR